MAKPLWEEGQDDDLVVRVSFLGSRWFMVTLAVVAGIIGLLILYYLFSSPGSQPSEPPVVEAISMPFKIKPENTGGAHIPHQDKQVYENLVQGGSIIDTPVIIAPPSEQPMDLPPRTIEVINPPFMIEEAPEVMIEEIKPPVEKIFINEEKIIVEEKPKKVKGKYKAQIAALHTKALAEKEWGILKRKFGGALEDKAMHISKVELPKKGTFYRVQVGGFDKKADVFAFCEKLKKKGGACFLVT